MFASHKCLPLSDRDGEVFSVDFAFEKNHFVSSEEHPRVSRPEEVQTSHRRDEVVPEALHLHNLMTADECDAVLKLCDAFGFRENGNRPASLAWVTLPEWTDTIRDRLVGLQGQPYGPHPRINHRWRVYRYGADCELPKHMDRACVPSYFFSPDQCEDGPQGEGEGEDELRAHPGELTDMSLLIYISRGDHVGGATRLYGVDGKETDVAPRCGNALSFPHRGEIYGDAVIGGPGGGLLHAGLPVTAGVKYIVRTDIWWEGGLQDR